MSDSESLEEVEWSFVFRSAKVRALGFCDSPPEHFYFDFMSLADLNNEEEIILNFSQRKTQIENSPSLAKKYQEQHFGVLNSLSIASDF